MFADKFDTYFPAALTIPSVTPLASFQAVGSWICNHDFMYFMEGKILPNCIKWGWEGAEVATLLLMPDLHTVTTLFDPFSHNFAFVSAAFDSLHHFAAIFPFLFVSYVTVPAFSSKLGLHVQRLGRKTVSLAFLPLRKCRWFCDNPFSFSFVETSLFLYFYPGGREYKIIALYF